jgi:hypothetical protein
MNRLFHFDTKHLRFKILINDGGRKISFKTNSKKILKNSIGSLRQTNLNDGKNYKVNSKEITKGFIKWASRSIMILSYFIIVLFILIKYYTPSETNDFNLTQYYISILIITFIIIYIIIKLLSPKLQMRKELCLIEYIALHKENGQEPPPRLIESLNRLRTLMIKYSKSINGIFPISEFYRSQLCREIDIYFSCVSESIYREYYRGRGKEIVGEKTSPTEQISYENLAEWMWQISSHLVNQRRLLRNSYSEISTLKYLMEEKNQFFQKNYPELFEQKSQEVRSYYNRREGTRRNVVMNLIDLGKLVSIALLSAFLAVWFGA